MYKGTKPQNWSKRWLLPLSQHQISQHQNKFIVPRTFIQDCGTKNVLGDIINDFNFEEKQAIYYYFGTDCASIDEISKVTELSQNHTLSVLNLYWERLSLKLDFFKKIIHYDQDDLLLISDLLFLESVP